MLKRSTLKLLFLPALLAMGLNSYSAEKNTPMEAMVAREQAVHDFQPAGDFWMPDNVLDQSRLLLQLKAVQPISVDYSKLAVFIQQRYPDIQLTVPKIGGGTYTINLVKYDFFSDGFKVEEDVNGVKRDFAYTPGVYYRGVVDGIPGSVAGFSFFNNELFGLFSIPGEGNYNLVPNTTVGNKYDYNQSYILYNDKDLLIKYPGGCGTDDHTPEFSRAAGKITTNLNEKVYMSCKEVRVYELADHSTYTNEGGSTNTTNYVTALFNNQSILYKNESVIVTLKSLVINTTTDTYASLISANSSFPYLQRFSNMTRNNLNGSDICVLLSTQNGNLGGVAWLQTMCRSFDYSQQDAQYPSQHDSTGPYCYCNIDGSSGTTVVPTYSWDVEVTTHEMGHILGSPHTHRCCWNPPGTGTTAIDGCYTLEGSCGIPNPQYPVGGGTIMSYCHLTSDGINFSNGFGVQPGDTVRSYTNYAFGQGCGTSYTVYATMAKANKTLAANRECTDPVSGYTYYFNDNNTATQTDDTLVMMINKNGNNIGNMDVSGFAVSTSTLPAFGSNNGATTTFPSGTSGVQAHSVAMNRYWKVNATTQPTSAVQVMLPFGKQDTADIHGGASAISPFSLSSIDLYKLNSTTIDPNPANNFPGATSAKFNIYSNGGSASTTTWHLTLAGSGPNLTYLANFLTTNLTGGASLFATYGTTSVENVAGNGMITVYPNPVNDQWMISVPDDITDKLSLELYSVDGKMVRVQALETGTINKVSTANLVPGLYFYRVVGSNSMFKGTLLKQ